jgi:hypothetical protein
MRETELSKSCSFSCVLCIVPNFIGWTVYLINHAVCAVWFSLCHDEVEKNEQNGIPWTANDCFHGMLMNETSMFNHKLTISRGYNKIHN